VQLPATLTLPQARASAQALAEALEQLPQGRVASLDASVMATFDTSALAVLLQASRAAQARGITLELRGAPAKLLELARLYGVDSLLPPAVSGNELEHRAATVPAADRA